MWPLLFSQQQGNNLPLLMAMQGGLGGGFGGGMHWPLLLAGSGGLSNHNLAL